MTGDFKLELRKALAETAVLLIGAFAGGALGYVMLGEHWLAQWVFPVLGAWLLHHAAGRLMPKPR